MAEGGADDVKNVLNVTSQMQPVDSQRVALPILRFWWRSDVYNGPAPVQSDREKLNIWVAACSANLSTLPE